MPDTMEGIVRPFQTEDFFTRGKIPVPSVNKEANPVVVSWGAKVSLPGAESDLIGVQIDKEEKYFERSRKTEKIRIENPNDPSQYVIVERPKQVTFDHKVPKQPGDFLKTPSGGGSASTTTELAPRPDRNIDNSAYYSDLAKEAADPNSTSYSEADPKPIISLNASMILKPAAEP
jgi:hypothetical protein